MKKLQNNFPHLPIFISLGIFLVSLWLRYPRIIPPFWTDEYSSVSQALLYLKYGLRVFLQGEHYIEYHNIFPQALIATSFLFLGKSVLAAKLPFVILGSILPVVIFFITKKLFNTATAIGATFLSIFSYWFITWSQQARGYPLQQILLLLFIFLIWEVLQTKSKKLALVCILIGSLGSMTHLTFLIVIFATLIYIILFNKQDFLKLIQKKLPELLTLTLVVFLFSFVTNSFQKITDYLQIIFSSGLSNNLWYYHSFLWREYGLIIFLAIIGWIFLFRQKYRLAVFLLTIISSYLFFHSFLFAPYVSRYLLNIFPLFFMLAAFALFNISKQISKQFSVFLTIGFSFFLIINGHLFTLFPKTFFSVNHQMREIALLDYDRVYRLIEDKVKESPERVAVIDTWPDRRDWYLSDYNIGTYTFRWENDGLMKQTPYQLNSKGEKEILLRPDEKLISTQNDLQAIIQSYPIGFLWIDDSTLPRDIIDYAEGNLHKELSINHYQFDDNPYSLWPATLYSWGVTR